MTAVVAPVVDAHVHVWSTVRQPQPWVDPATMPALARDFTAAADVVDLLAETGCDLAVLVQTLDELPESQELLDALDLPHVGAVTGWVDLAGDTDADLDVLLSHRNAAGLRGVRHLTHLEADPAWLLRDEVARGIECVTRRGLLVELVVRREQLTVVERLLGRHPTTSFVLDHLGKPGVASGELDPWRDDLGRLARHPHLVAKVSGLTLEADHATWTPADLEPYLDTAFEAFGAARLLWGSDWPLTHLCGGAGRWRQAFDDWSARLSPAERADLRGGSAARCYALA